MYSIPQQAVTNGYWKIEYLRAQPTAAASLEVKKPGLSPGTSAIHPLSAAASPPNPGGELTGRSVYGRSDGASSFAGKAAQAELQLVGHAHDGSAGQDRGLAGKDLLLHARGGADGNLARATVGVPAEPSHRDRVGPEILEALEERAVRGHLAFDAAHAKGDQAKRASPRLERSRTFRMRKALRWTAGGQHFRHFCAHARSHRRGMISSSRELVPVGNGTKAAVGWHRGATTLRTEDLVLVVINTATSAGGPNTCPPIRPARQ